jgi:predicted DNA-binding transcriptional regulator YafY
MGLRTANYHTQALQLIVTLADKPGMRSTGLQETLNVSRATLMRVMTEARHLGVAIGYSHESGYRIESGDVKLARQWLKLNQRETPLR